MSRDIPEPLRREVLIEAGHRCAIPTCRQTPVEIHHIVSWEKVQEHTFENLIALCPTCHRRYHNREIDLKSMKIYKQNLSILHHRYCDFERRLLLWFFENPGHNIRWFKSGFDILVMNLIKDGLLKDITGISDKLEYFGSKDEIGLDCGWSSDSDPLPRCYAITRKGREFTERWVHAESIE